MSTPTTAELDAQIVASIESAISQTVPLFPKAFVRVLSKVLGGTLVLLYRYVGFMLLQQYVTTATMRETTVNGQKVRPLVEQGKQFGVGEPEDATHAELVVTITVLTQVGSLPAGQLFSRDETGVIYALTAAVLLDAATVQGTVKAVSDQDGGGGAGEIGNLAVGDALSIVSAPAQVEPEATVASVAVVGEDAEEQEDYRARILRHTQFRPQGGAPADYREWGETVAGVKAIYPYKSEPYPGGVTVYVEAIAAVDADGIPTDAILDAVEDAIALNQDGLATNRPTNDLVDVFPITRIGFEVLIGGLQADGRELEVQTQIDEGLDEYLRTREPYIVGLSMLPRGDHITQGGVGGVAHEIAAANGATFQTVTLRIEGVVITAYRLEAGQLAKLDTDS